MYKYKHKILLMLFLITSIIYKCKDIIYKSKKKRQK